jgi:hypothetical protein
MDHVDRERARSLRFVQVVFALLALFSVASGLIVGYESDHLGLPDNSANAIAVAFLSVGIMNTALLFLWEKIFKGVST